LVLGLLRFNPREAQCSPCVARYRSIRFGRSIPEIIQRLISCAFPIHPTETVLGESIS
jgi:hypothetical protein